MLFTLLNYSLNFVLSDFVNLLIFILCNLLIINLLCSIFAFNPIYTILFLVLAFINLSLLLLTVGVKFVAFMILLIYVGAISILFMFVLMMLNLDLLLSQTKHSLMVPFYIYSFIFLVEFIIFIILNSNLVLYTSFIYIDWSKIFYTQSELLTLGIYIYNYNPISIILISLVLLIGLIGSIALVSEKRPIKKQILSIQLKDNKFKIILNK